MLALGHQTFMEQPGETYAIKSKVRPNTDAGEYYGSMDVTGCSCKGVRVCGVRVRASL